MKIIYLSSSKIPSRTANSVHVMKMCQSFSQNGHDITLYSMNSCDNKPDIYEYYGVNRIFNVFQLKSSPIKRLESVIYSYRVKKHVMKNDLPDLFYGRNIMSLLRLTSTNKPIIYESHAFPTTFKRKLVENHLFKKSNFTKLVVISNALKKEYLKSFKLLSEDKIIVAHDGADFPKVNNDLKSDKRDRTNRKKRIGYVGHLYPGRGIDIIVELARQLRDNEFHIIGGTEKDINYWKEKTKELTNIFFYGFIPNGELYKYYSNFDVLLAPYQKTVSVSGGKGDTSKWMSPLKIFEYMSYGKAIVVSDIPVLKEVLIHKRNCLLCDPDDINSWYEALILLEKDLELGEKIGETAFKHFLKDFTWDQRAQRVLL